MASKRGGKDGHPPWLSLRYQQVQHRNERMENSIDLTLSRGEVLYVPPFWASSTIIRDGCRCGIVCSVSITR